MNDPIERQAALEALDCELIITGRANAAAVREYAVNVYDRIRRLPPSAAPPDTIACADCRFWICHDRRCGYWNHGVKPLDWCSRAERREE